MKKPDVCRFSRDPRDIGHRCRWFIVVSIMTITSCGGGGSNDQSMPAQESTIERTVVTVRLESPNEREGAALITFDQILGDITETGTTQTFRSDIDGTTRLVLMNTSGGQLSFVTILSDISQPPSVTLLQVAGPDDLLREDLGPYSVTFNE